jgi:hypothetical protein
MSLVAQVQFLKSKRRFPHQAPLKSGKVALDQLVHLQMSQRFSVVVQKAQRMHLDMAKHTEVEQLDGLAQVE